MDPEACSGYCKRPITYKCPKNRRKKMFTSTITVDDVNVRQVQPQSRRRVIRADPITAANQPYYRDPYRSELTCTYIVLNQVMN